MERKKATTNINVEVSDKEPTLPRMYVTFFSDGEQVPIEWEPRMADPLEQIATNIGLLLQGKFHNVDEVIVRFERND